MYEQPPYPSRIKEHSFVTGILNKNGRTTDEPEDMIKVQPQVAMVKDLVHLLVFVLLPLTLSQPGTKAQFQVHQLYLSK